jgi:hypothetical protein
MGLLQSLTWKETPSTMTSIGRVDVGDIKSTENLRSSHSMPDVHVEDMITAAGRRVYDSETIELQEQQVERQIGPSLSRVDPRPGHLPLPPIAKESARTSWLRVDLDKHWPLCGEA